MSINRVIESVTDKKVQIQLEFNVLLRYSIRSRFL